MSANSINDWGIKLGFDSSKVDKGLTRIEKRMNRFNRNVNKGRTRKVSPNNLLGNPRGSGTGIGSGNPLAQANALERKRQSLEAQIFKAKNLGVNTLGASAANRTSNVQLIEKRRLALVRKIKVVEQRITSERKKQASIKGGFFGGRGGKGGAGAIDSITSSFGRLGIAAVSAYAIIAGGKALFESIKKMDSLKASMLAASGSAEQAKIDFEFIRKSANDLGRDLFTSAKGFQAIGAAMRGSFTEAQTKDVFLAASEASTAFGLSMDDTSGVMRAFSQMASKGTIQAEELRGQLGDRLPGAFQIAARAMGMTTDQLNKQLKAGKVLSSVFLPKFAKELRKTVKESGALAEGINTVVAAQNRMNTSMTEAAEQIGESGGKEIFKDIFSIVKDIVTFITPFATAVTKILSPIVKNISMWVGLIFSVLTPLAQILVSFVDMVLAITDLVDGAFSWLFSMERINGELDETLTKVSFLVRAFQVVRGVINQIRVIIGRTGIIFDNFVEGISNFFGGSEGVKNVVLKSGETVSAAEANIFEQSDKLVNALNPFRDTIKDRTGRITGNVPVVLNVVVNESGDAGLTTKAVETGLQNHFSNARPTDE